MKLWGKKTAPGANVIAIGRDFLVPVPIIAEGVEVREDSDGLLQLRASPRVKRSLFSSIAQKMGMHRHLRVDLDAFGSMFWRQIDGRHTLREIEEYMEQQTNHTSEETEKAVILFTKMLMQRHLIWLAVPKGAE